MINTYNIARHIFQIYGFSYM